MASANKVIPVGNCGRDPEIRYLPSGLAVANVRVDSIATELQLLGGGKGKGGPAGDGDIPFSTRRFNTRTKPQAVVNLFDH